MKLSILVLVFLGIISCKEKSKTVGATAVEAAQWLSAADLETELVSKLEGRHSAFYISWPDEESDEFNVEADSAAEVEIACLEGVIQEVISTSSDYWDWSIKPDRRSVSDPKVFPDNSPMLFLEDGPITLIIERLDSDRYLLQWDDSGSSEPFTESWMILANRRSEQVGASQH